MNLPEVVITSDTELHHRIMQLKYLKEEQETGIKQNVREIVYSMQPNVLVKNAIKSFAEDKELGDDLKTVALNLGRDFFIAKLFGKGSTIKGFLSSILVQKASEYVMTKHPDLLAKGIEKLESFFKKEHHHSDGEQHEEAAA